MRSPLSKLLTTLPSSPAPAAPTVSAARGLAGAQRTPTIGSAAGPPKTMRELLGRAYMVRPAVAWQHGASPLLGIGARSDVGGIDVREVPNFTVTSPGDGSATVGAFAPLAAFAEVLGDPGASLATLRLRLSIGGARLTIVRDGATATIALDAYRPDQATVPVSIDIPAAASGIGIAERRRVTTDGAASFELTVVTALRISQLHRFEDVRIMVALDGVVQRATEAEALLDRQRFGLSTLGEAARVSAHAIVSTDARTSAAARAVAPLVLAALREAVAIAKPKDEEKRRRPVPLSKRRKKNKR